MTEAARVGLVRGNKMSDEKRRYEERRKSLEIIADKANGSDGSINTLRKALRAQNKIIIAQNDEIIRLLNEILDKKEE